MASARYVLQLLPKRNDKNLLCGTIWVDANTYLIRRTEGEPQKSPSWWLRDLHVVFVYGEAGGMWLPTSSEFTAKVRLFGPASITRRFAAASPVSSSSIPERYTSRADHASQSATPELQVRAHSGRRLVQVVDDLDEVGLAEVTSRSAGLSAGVTPMEHPSRGLRC